MKLKFLTLFFASCIFWWEASAQDMYRTVHGDIAISINEHDSIQLMISNDLSLALDFETSKFTFRVPYESFRTRIDTTDSKLNAMKGVMLEFSGKLNITINTQNFSPQKYNMEGQLTGLVKPVPIKGNGSLSCIPSGDRATPACTFLITFETSLSALNLKELFPMANDGIRVDVRQSILEKDNE